jgi:glucose/arabinose dehydrogenase
MNHTLNEEVPSNAFYQAAGHPDCSAYQVGTPLGEHIAPLGLSFKDASTILIAERGGFGVQPPVGHQISKINADLTGYEPYITGFLDPSGASWGRPVDVQVLGGAIFVSDDKSHSIYRFTQREEVQG